MANSGAMRMAAGSKNFSATALSTVNIGIAKIAKMFSGSYFIFSDTPVPPVALWSSFTLKIISQFFAIFCKPSEDLNSRRPSLDAEDFRFPIPKKGAFNTGSLVIAGGTEFVHVHRTDSGMIGGKPKISSTCLPTASGCDTSSLEATPTDVDTILGQFLGDARNCCTSAGDWSRITDRVVRDTDSKARTRRNANDCKDKTIASCLWSCIMVGKS